MRTRDQIIQDTEPFPDSVIEQVDAGGGRKADYVSWNQYAQRLLLQHGAHRYEVISVTNGKQLVGPKDDKREVWLWAVSVRLYLEPDEWYDAVGEGDSPTSAESNAYKRACAHAGIGLHLYGGFWLHERLKKTANESGSE